MISLLLALVAYMTIEAPFMELGKIFQGRKSSPFKKSMRKETFADTSNNNNEGHVNLQSQGSNTVQKKDM